MEYSQDSDTWLGALGLPCMDHDDLSLSSLNMACQMRHQTSRPDVSDIQWQEQLSSALENFSGCEMKPEAALTIMEWMSSRRGRSNNASFSMSSFRVEQSSSGTGPRRKLMKIFLSGTSFNAICNRPSYQRFSIELANQTSIGQKPKNVGIFTWVAPKNSEIPDLASCRGDPAMPWL